MIRAVLGFAAAGVAGAIWGGVWMIVIGASFSLVSGAVAAPPAGAAMIAGALAALVRAGLPTAGLGSHISAAATVLVVLAAATGLQPLGLDLDTVPAYQAVAVALLIYAVVLSNHRCMRALPIGSLSRYNFEALLVRVLKGFGLVLFTVMVVLPFYVMLMTSFKSQQSLLANPLDYSLDLDQGFVALFDSYIELFTNFNFGTFMLNSALVSVATVIITLGFAIPGAYAVARLRFPGQAFMSQSILLIYMIPAIVLVIPLYAVFSQLGLRNSLLGLLIVYPATTIPVALYMLQGYFRGLPAELEEAGLMDGLRRVGVIAKITLPLSLPALASVALYVFMIAWNEFLFAFMFLDDIKIFTLSRGVVSLNTSEIPRQHLMAGAVVTTVPVLLVFLACERFMVSGLTAGSVKG